MSSFFTYPPYGLIAECIQICLLVKTSNGKKDFDNPGLFFNLMSLLKYAISFEVEVLVM